MLAPLWASLITLTTGLGTRLIMALAASAMLAGQALAHGAVLEARTAQAIAVEAYYDSGEPMIEAQVSVFSPDNPQQPWLRGVTDDQGRFVFVPGDATGRWTVQTRQAGHGSMAYVDVSASTTAASALAVAQPQQGISPMQRAIMAISITWGLIGTALYFRRRGAADART